MSITNKYQNSDSQLGINLNRGYFYDVTPQVKNIKNMDLLYSTTLFDTNLSIDVNPNDREINYISDPSLMDLTTNIVGKSINDNGKFFRYKFRRPGRSIFDNILNEGWTAETALNFDSETSSGFDVFYYLGVAHAGLDDVYEDGVLVEDNSEKHKEDYLHNNLAFAFDENRSIVVRSVRYMEECYDCGENPTKGEYVFEHKFNKPICTDDISNFAVTIVFERDGNIVQGMCKELNTKFIESVSERMGTLKIYVNGLLYGSIKDFEDIITRKTINTPPVIDFVQGWGFSDDYRLSDDYNMVGTFEGHQLRGRFHTKPLEIHELRHNYKLLRDQYNITDCFSIGCGPNF